MTAQERVASAVVQLLQQERLLGEIILQLPRWYSDQDSAAIGLAWKDDQLLLRLSSKQIDQLRQDELVNLLAHEALHLVWQHPLRYYHAQYPRMVQAATDIAVNQYLKEAPNGSATISQVERALQKKLPVKADSQVYLRILKQTTVKQQERLRRDGISLEGTKRGAAVKETHQGWQATNHRPGNELIRQGQLTKILRKALQQTPQRDRGLLPGEVIASLEGTHHSVKPTWQRRLQRQIGLVAHGQQDSHARFNRRQPWRMDLAGAVTHLVPEVNVFVDNSGSVTDNELETALMTIGAFAEQAQMAVQVYSFDAKVDEASKQVISSKQQVHLVRHGGGGTRFQSVFDFLRANHVSRSTALNIIMTDGWGEHQLQTYHYRNVCWLLMTGKVELSVQSPVGQVLEMEEGK